VHISRLLRAIRGLLRPAAPLGLLVAAHPWSMPALGHHARGVPSITRYHGGGHRPVGSSSALERAGAVTARILGRRAPVTARVAVAAVFQACGSSGASADSTSSRVRRTGPGSRRLSSELFLVGEARAVGVLERDGTVHLDRAVEPSVVRGPACPCQRRLKTDQVPTLGSTADSGGRRNTEWSSS
jgi:hypothetical protein